MTGGVHNVWIEPNDVVYAVHNGTSDLHMIDISDPRNPFEAGRWGLPKVANLKSLHEVIVQDPRDEILHDDFLPSAVGMRFFTQFVSFDRGANALGLTYSNGVETRVGRANH